MAKGNISGADFLKRARAMRHSPETFQLYHFTYNQKTGIAKGLRKVEQCRVRQALPRETFQYDPDLYLTYVDVELNEPRTCFKKLARYVAFPPNYELLKIEWF